LSGGLRWIEENVDRDVMVMGDLNADGSYFNEDTGWTEVCDEFSESYKQKITNDMDTTMAVSSNTYDRIITNIATNGSSCHPPGVFQFENVINLTDVVTEGCNDNYINDEFCPPTTKTEEEIRLAAAKEISDHYPVEMCLSCAASNDSDMSSTINEGTPCSNEFSIGCSAATSKQGVAMFAVLINFAMWALTCSCFIV
ncbi:hypothetical protein CYMTET_17096, partial [Cymbomonas tetramitiformis]